MKRFLGLAFLGLAAGAAAAHPEPKSGETVIPFVSSIRAVEWKAAGDDALYVRGGKGEWYFVRTANRCSRLRAARAIGFQTSALDQLDRHGAILVQGVRCPVASITASPGPPRKRSKAG
ncbi:MAG TPA: DUF6491 family protein [Allosphingosinicella sp.]|nr:DUF6491 family protein [Allosphingosinicella sp.]